MDYQEEAKAADDGADVRHRQAWKLAICRINKNVLILAAHARSVLEVPKMRTHVTHVGLSPRSSMRNRKIHELGFE